MVGIHLVVSNGLAVDALLELAELAAGLKKFVMGTSIDHIYIYMCICVYMYTCVIVCLRLNSINNLPCFRRCCLTAAGGGERDRFILNIKEIITIVFISINRHCIKVQKHQ